MALAVLLLAPAVAFAGPSWKVPRDFASAVLMEAETGEVLFQRRAEDPRPPASTTKLMVALVVMDEIQAGRVSLADSVRVSRRARRLGGTQVYLEEGEVFALEELMQALLIASANDASVAIAEHVGGSYERFVELMNRRARAMGLERTRFYNTHGLDDVPEKRNETCALDLARIARELVDYPKILEWSSTPSAPFRDGTFTLYNTNRLLGRIDGLDGLKTGFTARAGFCLVATAERDGMRLITVVLGSRTSRGRFLCAKHLVETGFLWFEKVPVARAGDPLDLAVPVVGGELPELPLVAGRTLSLVIPREKRHRLEERIRIVDAVDAPVEGGTTLGYREVWLESRLLARVPAVAACSVPRAGLLERLWRGLGLGQRGEGGPGPVMEEIPRIGRRPRSP